MTTPPADNEKRPETEDREESGRKQEFPGWDRRPPEEQAAEERPEEDVAWETDVSEEEMELLAGRRPQGEGGALRRDWKLLPRMFPYLRPYRKFAGASVAVTILVALVTLAEPWPLAFVIDGVLGSDPIPGWVTAIVGDGVGKLILFAVIATLVLTLLSGGLTVVNEYLSTTVNQYMTLDFRSDLVQHVQRLSFSHTEGERTGVLMYRLNQQSGAIGQIVTGLPAIGQSVLTMAGMAFITIKIDPLLALIALGVTPFIFYSTNFYANRIEPRLYRVRGLEAMNLAIVHEMVQMLRVVLAFGRERREYWRFRNQGEKAVKARVDLTVRQTAFQLGVQFITAVGTAAVLGVGAHLALKGRITPGELLVVLTYIASVYQPMEETTQTIANYQQQFIAFRHASDLLEEAPQVTEKPDARAIERARGEIELDGIGFGYRKKNRVLHDISFRIPPGQDVAIVGPTGAGKSTLASLLPRFYDPDEGQVLIDGIDLRDLTLPSLRSQFSIVLQEPLLFQTSILENIRYGKPDASDEEVEAAAQAANAHDFITQLPDGYETTLGERGAKISGGERQRIAVARAFLRDAPILILDEPTSSIDSRTESVILDALDRLMEGRTTIVIAHRLSTLRDVDRIVVLDEGRLIEQGTHEELLATGGLYRRIWEAQTGLERVELPEEAREAAPAPAASSNGAGDGPRQEVESDFRLREVLARPVPIVRPPTGPPAARIVVPVVDNLACTRLALESVLANTEEPSYEVVVVDNGSEDSTRQYLEVLAARNRHVFMSSNQHDVGFVGACNQALEAAVGDVVVLLSSDTIVPPGWLVGLTQQLEDRAIGLIAPATNGFDGAGHVSAPYETYAEMLRFARERANALRDRSVVDIDLPEMSCVAMRRGVFASVGPLDEHVEVGQFEDDYARRVRDAGYRVVCAENLFVHQFRNREYAALASRVGPAAHEHVPEKSTLDQPPGGNGEVRDDGSSIGQGIPASAEVQEAESSVQTQATPASPTLEDAPPPVAPPPADASVEGPRPSPIPERTVETGYRIAPALLAVIVAVGLALRSLAAQESLFGDELFSYFVTTQPSLSGVFDQIELTEATPPLFYLLGWLSGKLGDPTTLIRLPSVLFGTAAIPILYLLGERFRGRVAGLIAAALIAVLPFTVFYGSEARAYALLLFLVPLSTLALLRALDGDRRLWWGIYGLAAVLALYTHFIGALAIGVQAAWALWAERRQWRWLLAVNAAAAIAFVPWLGMLDSSVDSLGVAELLRPLTAGNVLSDTGDALFGHPFADLKAVPGLVSLLMLALAAAIAAAAFVVSRRRASGATGATTPSRSLGSRREIVLLALLVVVPPLLVLAYSIAETSIYLSRNLTTAIPYLCLLAGLGVAALPRRAMIPVATLVIAAALLGSVRMVADYPRPDLRAAADEIERRAPPETRVIQPVGVIQLLAFGGGPLSSGAPSPDARSAPVAGVADRGLEIHLDDEYPLSHDLKDLGRQPRGKDFFVVLPHPIVFGPVAKAADAAGAEVIGGREFDGFDRVFVRRYSR